MTPLLLHHIANNKYVRPRNTRTEMYAGRVACGPLLSHAECTPRTILRLEKRRKDKRTDKQTNGRTDTRLLHYAYR